MLSIGILSLLAWAAPQTSELPLWVLELSRIKRHLRANFERVPNFVCMETVERSQKMRARARLQHLDTIRLEVAFVGGKELFARPGAKQFTESDPAALISQGAFGTGAFSTTAINLFVHDVARTTGYGEERDGGKVVLRYDFEIPQMLAHYRLSSGSVTAEVGEQGSFWVDRETLDLREIEVRATSIPIALNVAELTTTIHFERVHIGSSDVILPKLAEMVMSSFDGGRNRNVTAFSGCREYMSESRITFKEEAPGPAEET